MPRWFGAPVMVLETVGRRSGRPRATPILYLRDEDRLVVMASNAGHDSTPAWWLNLRAAGEGTAVLAGERWKVRPRIPQGEERQRLWKDFNRMYPAAEDYVGFTHREIPLIVLEPA